MASENTERKNKSYKIKKAALAAFGDIEEDFRTVLLSAERLEYNGAEIYLLNKEQFEQIHELEKKGSKNMEFFDIAEEDAVFSGKAFKILNKDRKSPALSYRCYMRLSPLILLDEEIVKKRLIKEIPIWVNVQRKGLREAIENGNFSEAEVSKMKRELDEKIEDESQKMQEIQENFEDYEVIVTNYETASTYPTIYYFNKEGKKNVEHLSIKMPNILWFEEETKEKKGFRGDAKVVHFVKTAERLGSMVYFKKKSKP